MHDWRQINVVYIINRRHIDGYLLLVCLANPKHLDKLKEILYAKKTRLQEEKEVNI